MKKNEKSDKIPVKKTDPSQKTEITEIEWIKEDPTAFED